MEAAGLVASDFAHGIAGRLHYPNKTVRPLLERTVDWIRWIGGANYAFFFVLFAFGFSSEASFFGASVIPDFA